MQITYTNVLKKISILYIIYTNCITIKNKCVFKYVSWLVAVKEYIFFRQTDTHKRKHKHYLSRSHFTQHKTHTHILSNE